MAKKEKKDNQTASLFLTLAVLTFIFVLGVRWVLIATSQPLIKGPTEITEKAQKN